MYEYRAIIVSNYDGDTLRMDIDLGFDIMKSNQAFRLYGINTPELGTPGGLEAKRYVAEKLPRGTKVTVKTLKDKKEKYGRYLVNITMPCGNDLSASLITEGLGEPYFGGARRAKNVPGSLLGKTKQ